MSKRRRRIEASDREGQGGSRGKLESEGGAVRQGAATEREGGMRSEDRGRRRERDEERGKRQIRVGGMRSVASDSNEGEREAVGAKLESKGGGARQGAVRKRERER